MNKQHQNLERHLRSTRQWLEFEANNRVFSEEELQCMVNKLYAEKPLCEKQPERVVVNGSSGFYSNALHYVQMAVMIIERRLLIGLSCLIIIIIYSGLMVKQQTVYNRAAVSPEISFTIVSEMSLPRGSLNRISRAEIQSPSLAATTLFVTSVQPVLSSTHANNHTTE